MGLFGIPGASVPGRCAGKEESGMAKKRSDHDHWMTLGFSTGSTMRPFQTLKPVWPGVIDIGRMRFFPNQLPFLRIPTRKPGIARYIGIHQRQIESLGQRQGLFVQRRTADHHQLGNRTGQFHGAGSTPAVCNCAGCWFRRDGRTASSRTFGRVGSRCFRWRRASQCTHPA